MEDERRMMDFEDERRMMDFKDILYNSEDGIARVTLNNPEKMNRLSIETMQEVVAAVNEAKEDESVRVVVIQAAGDKAFCAGANLADFSGLSPVESRDVFRAFADLSKVFVDLGKPSIAAVNGLALAGGFGLAIYPDITIASDRAKFGLPEINVGIWSCMVSASLPRIVGRKKALELLATGEMIDAREAERIGLVNKVVPHEELEDTVRNLALTLSNKSPAVMRLGRDSYYTMLDMNFDQAVEYMLDVLALVMSTEDHKEGLSAFSEKRKPVWRNK
ncbi:putative 3-hydroxybutyryl-CoA dehydratase [delta proteobacterium NaphS2]|nr:putative 3-hydroxybutyryl-CoA dehydratase [delta proteobacterium NaphS2]